jgi:two-component system NtrC family sensor kinase
MALAYLGIRLAIRGSRNRRSDRRRYLGIVWGIVTLLAAFARWLVGRDRTAAELRYLRFLVAQTADFLLVYAPDRRLIFANSAFEALTGHRLTDAAPTTLELFHPDDRAALQSAFDAAFAGGSSGQSEVRLVTSDGAFIWVVATWMPLYTYIGRLHSVALFLHDITMQKNEAAQIDQLHARLRQRDKLAMLGQLLAGLVHDLNTPLTSILLSAELLLQDAQDFPAIAQNDLALIVAQATHASEIVRQLLAFARERAPQRSLTDLNTIVTQSIDLRAYTLRQQGILVDICLTPNLPSIEADPFQIQQGVLNILANAEQAFQDERWLRRTAPHDPARLSICTAYQRFAETGSTHVILQVSDNGPGIPPELREKVFDPFVTTKPEGRGTGLGLAIVAEIIRNYGGQIAIVSPAQGGTTIEMRFPASETWEQRRDQVQDQAQTAAPKALLISKPAHAALAVNHSFRAV